MKILRGFKRLLHSFPLPVAARRRFKIDLIVRKWAAKFLIGVITMTFCACAALMADRQAQEAHHRQMVTVMDNAHIFVTTGDIPKGKPYKVLGVLKWSEPFSTDAVDKDRIDRRLKDMALAKYSDQADAVIKVNTDVESTSDTDTVTVTGEVIQFESSADRAMMHSMWENLVVSPK